ncbi:GIY-YIG nuclease family protein [Nostocoides sp. HKS02]|uniref:GIY-YIG nuclease family protein n=1 Tax=Nostocoides sp. HKS02 TaxID=1813880 RepID=UPI0012B4D929|nr:GIY-YIG nuclease family protein [Tetrasphaera sp. HKS02]QGN58895.1 hypothetical protein GKE56_14490 [Tetrasphaera sp. HKS02]
MTTSGRPLAPRLEHFGERLRNTVFGHKMTREFYAYPHRSPHQRFNRDQFDEGFWEGLGWAYRDEAHTQHSDVYLLVQRDAALTNFDLSMRYFEGLDTDQFEDALQYVLARGRLFKPVQYLPDWDGVPGAYVMVFDEYRQFYIGQANDIRKRIKQHWSRSKSFDRLIWGSKYDSIFPVDELRAFDTTRIYAAPSSNSYAVEHRAEKAADRRFCLNRMAGGAPSPLTLMLTALDPRTRMHGGVSRTLSMEGFEVARLDVQRAVARGGSAGSNGPAKKLSSMDMSIYSVVRPDGSTFFWSRRDAVAEAAVRGDLSVAEFAAFLTEMGETIVWPNA